MPHKIKQYAPYAYRGHAPSGSIIDGCELCGICSSALWAGETRGSEECNCPEQRAINATHDWESFETPVGPPEFGETHDGWRCRRCGAISHHKMMTAYCGQTCSEYAMGKVLG